MKRKKLGSTFLLVSHSRVSFHVMMSLSVAPTSQADWPLSWCWQLTNSWFWSSWAHPHGSATWEGGRLIFGCGDKKEKITFLHLCPRGMPLAVCKDDGEHCMHGSAGPRWAGCVSGLPAEKSPQYMGL